MYSVAFRANGMIIASLTIERTIGGDEFNNIYSYDFVKGDKRQVGTFEAPIEGDAMIVMARAIEKMIDDRLEKNENLPPV